jgi:hypothetical protein
MLTDNAWLMFSPPPYLVQQRRLERDRDSYGYPKGEARWGPWRTVVEFYDKTQAENVTRVLDARVMLTNTPPYHTVRTDREYRMVTR